MDTMPETEALDLIAQTLSGTHWDAETIFIVAELVRATGRTVNDIDNVEGADPCAS